MAEIVAKRLTRTDVYKGITIPTKSLHLFPDLSGTFSVTDESGRVWSFRIYIRKNHKYPKPVITKGWRGFACTNKLNVGDTVKFYSEQQQSGSVMYRGKVERIVKIFGKIFG